MKKDINLKFNPEKIKKLLKRTTKHATFAVTITVLLVGVFVVWQINKLASAEPTPEEQAAATSPTNLPKVDPKAISQIEKLEQSNVKVRSLFNKARNNPFQE
jgi:hypothetical protein